MAEKYIISKPSGGNTRPLGLTRASRVVRRQANRRAPEDARFRLKKRGEDWSSWRRSLKTTMERWKAMLANQCRVGDVVVLDIEDHPYSITTRVIEVSPPLIQTEGNNKIDEIWTYIKRDLGISFRNGGICNKRYIDGTTTWTQHSPWPAPDPGSNALDIFMSTMNQMYDLSNKLVIGHKDGKISVGRLIIGQKQWTPQQGWHYYGGHFHYHIHVEGQPTRTGYPSGSC